MCGGWCVRPTRAEQGRARGEWERRGRFVRSEASCRGWRDACDEPSSCAGASRTWPPPAGSGPSGSCFPTAPWSQDRASGAIRSLGGAPAGATRRARCSAVPVRFLRLLPAPVPVPVSCPGSSPGSGPVPVLFRFRPCSGPVPRRGGSDGSGPSRRETWTLSRVPPHRPPSARPHRHRARVKRVPVGSAGSASSRSWPPRSRSRPPVAAPAAPRRPIRSARAAPWRAEQPRPKRPARPPRPLRTAPRLRRPAPPPPGRPNPPRPPPAPEPVGQVRLSGAPPRH